MKINETVNKFLLAGDKFMPEMHLKQPVFTYSACELFAKSKERIEKFMQTGNRDFNYRNELDKVFFQHGMAYGKSKDLENVLNQTKFWAIKHLEFASDSKYDGCQGGLALMVYKFFDKKWKWYFY